MISKRDVELSILKRKLGLLYIQINSQDEVNLDLIDEALKEEFLEVVRANTILIKIGAY